MLDVQGPTQSLFNLAESFGSAVLGQSHSSVLRRQQGAYSLFSPLKDELIWATSGAAFVSQSSASSKKSVCVLPFLLLTLVTAAGQLIFAH